MNDYGLHLPIESDSGDETDFTQRETFGWLEKALIWISSLCAIAVIYVFVATNWPLFVAAVR